MPCTPTILPFMIIYPRLILNAIDLEYPTPESQTRAYIYTFLAFTCTLLKAQADVQHLWYGWRMSMRIRSELMEMIYDKVLKRKDFSGVVNKEEKEKDKDKPMTDDKGKWKRVLYPPVVYVWHSADGRSRQDESWEKAGKGKSCKGRWSKGWRRCWEDH